MHKRTLYVALITLLALVPFFQACAPQKSTPPAPAARTWIVADVRALATVPIEPTQSQLAPAQPERETLVAWNNPPSRWMELERKLVAREWMAPTRAARLYALLAVGINDALRVADAVRAKGWAVSDDAVMARVAERIIGYNHPLLAEIAQQEAATASWIGVWRKIVTPTEVAVGHQIGDRVADQVIAWAQNDGADAFASFPDQPATPGVWQRTPPRLWSALDPGWGDVKPIGLASVSNLNAAKPPAWDSAEFVADRAAFVEAQQRITDGDQALAKKWAAGMGSMTPAGMWLDITGKLIEEHHSDVHYSATIYAIVAVSMHNAFIACWQSKYLYLVERPISWMRQSDPVWKSFIETPPFPSYPSGHSTVSATASTVLAAYFPSNASDLTAQAKEAAQSRIIAGIHWPLDSRGGLDQGQRIGTEMLTTAPTALVFATR